MIQTLVGLVVQMAVLSGPGAVDDAMTAERLERMLAAGDKSMVVQTFRRHPTEVLPFIDGYLEGGLAMIEQGKDADEAMASFRRGIAFAELADTAFSEAIFVEYSAGFASWSPTEQRLFREGQKAYRDGRQATDPAVAVPLLQRSYDLAEQLGDSWGMAMASERLAAGLAALGRSEEAGKVVAKAIELNSRLQLRDQHVRSLVLCGDIRRDMKTPDGGVGHYRLAWQLLPSTADAAWRRKVLQSYVAAVERSNPGEAERLRKENAEL
ncbi:MAG: hypothetical protein KDA22_10095, partial [Phycisphaerales bacterium]|nr:hypothetical protein [Phycisphaerales bacterium]